MEFECSLDDRRITSCGEGLTGQWTGTNVQHGRHNFKVKGTDNKGNIVEAEVRGWMVDAISPTITFTDAPGKTNNLPQLTWRSSEEATFECKLDNEPYKGCGSGVNGEWSQKIDREGRHVLYVRGRDAVGNTGPSSTHSWTVGTFLSFAI